MLIKSRMGISADGFVATPDGWPALVTAPDFVPAASHGYPEFIEGVSELGECQTVRTPRVPDHSRRVATVRL